MCESLLSGTMVTGQYDSASRSVVMRGVFIVFVFISKNLPIRFCLFRFFALFAIQINSSRIYCLNNGTGLAEEVGGEDEGDHEDGHEEEDDLQPLVGLATEGDGLEALAFKTGCVVVVMTMMMVMMLFGHFILRFELYFKMVYST